MNRIEKIKQHIRIERVAFEQRARKERWEQQLPTVPGLYRDGNGKGHPWVLDEKGRWTDHLGFAASRRHSWLLGQLNFVFITSLTEFRKGNFTFIQKGKKS